MRSLQHRTAFFIFALTLGSTGVDAGTEKSGHGTGDDPSGQKLPEEAPIVQLSADTDTKTAKLSLTFNLDPPFAGEDQATSNFLSIVGSTPLAQGDTFENVASLDQLASATTVKLKYTWASSESHAVADRTSPVFLQKCYALLAEAKGNTNKACTVARVQSALDAMKKTPGQDQASVNDITKGIADLQSMQKPMLDHMWLFGLSGQVGYDVHKFYDVTTLKAGSNTKIPFDVGLSAAYVFAGGRSSLNFTADYQDGFKDAGSAKTECLTTTAPVTSCVNGFIGPPTRKERELLGVDLRFIGNAFGVPIGVDPGVTYDARSHSEAIQFPIYFITDTSGGLTGGIRYDWTSEKHISVIGIFASAAFSILGNGN